MEDYDILVEKCQSGEISHLDFLLAQEDLADMYITDMLSAGVTPTSESALEWLSRYENENLYL